MRNTIELIEMTELVNTVVGSVFFANDDNENDIDYKPEYLPVITEFCKIKYYNPDVLESDDIQLFYIDWINGKYMESLKNINPRQNEMIDKAIAEKIEFIKTQMGNPLNNALAGLINIIQDAIDKFSASFGDFNVNDVKKIMAQASDFTKNMDKNSKSIVKAVTENVVEKAESSEKKNTSKIVSNKKRSNKTNTSSTPKADAMPTSNNSGEK